MKVKTSITLTQTTLKAVDAIVGKSGNRSAFIEEAVRAHLVRTQRERRDARDRALLDKYADELNREARDAARFQVALFDEDER
jgi:metal-responsive CopG/Arc/MetJ family transcriptional regulator